MHSVVKAPFAPGGGLGLDVLLKAAVAEPHKIDSALVALARLKPGSAAQWLLDEEEQARSALTRSQLSAVLDQLATSALSDVGLRQSLLQLACAYSDAIPAPAAARLVSASIAEAPKADALLETLLRREPSSPEILRIAADQAIQRNDASAAHALLTRLGRADPRLSTVTHVSRSRAALPKLDLPPVRAAFLSTYTVDPLLPYVDLECAELGLAPDFYVSPFNSWAQDVINPASTLYLFKPDVVFLALAIDDLVPELGSCPSSSRLEELGRQALERVVQTASRYAERTNALVVVHNFFSAYRDPLGIARTGNFLPRSAWIADLNARLAAALTSRERVHVLDVQDVLLHRADGPLENSKMRHLASMRLGDRMLGEIARTSAGYIAALTGLTRKCIVLDLDNTLWGGVVGEKGPHGITLANTSPGSEYREFQLFLQSLSERGILLAINSKNNPDDAIEALRNNEWMVLREDAFSAIVMNWSPKPENIRQIASELNIGLDSLIFVDDNPHERELMRQTLPEVLTVDLPTDPALYRSALEMLPQLQVLGVTQEDRQRVGLYRSGKQRDAIKANAATIEEYLHSLDIAVRIEPASDKSLPRIHQLFQRTNQFNLTTRRHDVETLRRASRGEDERLYALSAKDRFGDHGLVAVALVRAEDSYWCIDSFLMSCRVIGYGVETALLSSIASEALENGCRRLFGEFISTPKNKPARDFYEKHGFACYDEADGAIRWELDLQERPVAQPEWIAVKEERR